LLIIRDENHIIRSLKVDYNELESNGSVIIFGRKGKGME
jgi:hypothetical protein